MPRVRAGCQRAARRPAAGRGRRGRDRSRARAGRLRPAVVALRRVHALVRGGRGRRRRGPAGRGRPVARPVARAPVRARRVRVGVRRGRRARAAGRRPRVRPRTAGRRVLGRTARQGRRTAGRRPAVARRGRRAAAGRRPRPGRGPVRARLRSAGHRRGLHDRRPGQTLLSGRRRRRGRLRPVRTGRLTAASVTLFPPSTVRPAPTAPRHHNDVAPCPMRVDGVRRKLLGSPSDAFMYAKQRRSVHE